MISGNKHLIVPLHVPKTESVSVKNLSQVQEMGGKEGEKKKKVRRVGKTHFTSSFSFFK